MANITEVDNSVTQLRLLGNAYAELSIWKTSALPGYHWGRPELPAPEPVSDIGFTLKSVTAAKRQHRLGLYIAEYQLGHQPHPQLHTRPEHNASPGSTGRFGIAAE